MQPHGMAQGALLPRQRSSLAMPSMAFRNAAHGLWPSQRPSLAKGKAMRRKRSVAPRPQGCRVFLRFSSRYVFLTVPFRPITVQLPYRPLGENWLTKQQMVLLYRSGTSSSDRICEIPRSLATSVVFEKWYGTLRCICGICG